MDEIWERAVETALDGQTDHGAARTLTLDGAVKCVQGRLPPPNLLERFENLEHLSIANIGVSSLEQFPRLKNLQKLILSDNRIAGGLEFLVQAGLDSLRDLDLSNNRIQYIEDLAPLAHLRLVSLDLYECPVTRVKDYRSKVFGMIKSLRYLDKMDAEENERPESDDESDDDESDDEDDPGSGEIDGEDRPFGRDNGHSENVEGVVDVDEEEESDADEEEVDNEDRDGEFGEPESTGRLTSTEGEIDGHEQGEEDGDDDGETGEEEQVVEDDREFEVEDEDDAEEEDEDCGTGYLVQPVGQAEEHDGSDMEPGNEDDAEDEEEVEDDDEVQDLPPSSSSLHPKRKRDDSADEDENGEDDEEDDDVVEFSKSSSKKHH
ncbi:Acidic leucine-rich nuclear phosphoprotein 32-related protein [Citrus sinensis]|uniref:Acidic leucine-rich nuclear phosphoprotein 32-related protein n=1 Tax=Citrus sinensis TaxID=2711 RepID=A0ACB8J3J7_CITSI|nr:Acidic leucine-rich nuclear phosphoprotein 32-related protein [Citrus sinensis]